MHFLHLEGHIWRCWKIFLHFLTQILQDQRRVFRSKLVIGSLLANGRVLLYDFCQIFQILFPLHFCLFYHFPYRKGRSCGMRHQIFIVFPSLWKAAKPSCILPRSFQPGNILHQFLISWNQPFQNQSPIFLFIKFCLFWAYPHHFIYSVIKCG